jgi:hypothetical protein
MRRRRKKVATTTIGSSSFLMIEEPAAGFKGIKPASLSFHHDQLKMVLTIFIRTTVPYKLKPKSLKFEVPKVS